MMEGYSRASLLTEEEKAFNREKALLFFDLILLSFPFDVQASLGRRFPINSGEMTETDPVALDVKAQCIAFMFGVKPAIVFERMNKTAELEMFLEESGKKFFVHRYEVANRDMTMIVDEELVMNRINEELVFAQELGWKEGMTIEGWLTQPKGGENKVKQKSIMGFFLGYPRSAILAYGKGVIENPELVQIGDEGVVLSFVTASELAHEADVLDISSQVKAAFSENGIKL